jgi:hypothetical protein
MKSRAPVECAPTLGRKVRRYEYVACLFLCEKEERRDPDKHLKAYSRVIFRLNYIAAVIRNLGTSGKKQKAFLLHC